MIGVNKAIIIGNLGRDPELKQTSSGSSVLTFSVATNQRWKDSAGELQERTEWHNIIAFGKLAEICDQLLVKGVPVYVEGKIQTRSYEGEEGNERKNTEIVASIINVLREKISLDTSEKNNEKREDESSLTGKRGGDKEEEDDSILPF